MIGRTNAALMLQAPMCSNNILLLLDSDWITQLPKLDQTIFASKARAAMIYTYIYCTPSILYL